MLLFLGSGFFPLSELTSALCLFSWTKERRVLLVKSFEKKKWVVVRPLPFSRTYPQQYDVSSSFVFPLQSLHTLSLHLSHMLSDFVFTLGDRCCCKPPHPGSSVFSVCIVFFPCSDYLNIGCLSVNKHSLSVIVGLIL